MKVLERNVVRLAVVQHLRCAYGIKIKNWNKNRNKQTSANSVSSIKKYDFIFDYCLYLVFFDAVFHNLTRQQQFWASYQLKAFRFLEGLCFVTN